MRTVTRLFNPIRSCRVFPSSGWNINTAKWKVCTIPNTLSYFLDRVPVKLNHRDVYTSRRKNLFPQL